LPPTAGFWPQNREVNASSLTQACQMLFIEVASNSENKFYFGFP
jgi:hypothetical protein